MSLIHKPELLAPAGNFEKLEIAIHYGADAVYLAGKDFSLRNFSGNFTIEEMHRAVELAHACHVKVYVACNIYSRNHEQQQVTDYLAQLSDIDPDAVIIADPGILMEARRVIPRIPVCTAPCASPTQAGAFSAVLWKTGRPIAACAAIRAGLTTLLWKPNGPVSIIPWPKTTGAAISLIRMICA